MTRRPKSLLLASLTLGIAFYMAADGGRAPHNDSPGEKAGRLKRVRVAEVETTHDSRELRFSGTTRAARRGRLAFSTSGRLVARPVEIGDQVRRGQLLAQLTDRELKNARLTARASLAELAARRAQSERDHARAKQLVAAKAATSEELERTAAAVEALKAAEQAATARLEEAQRRLGETSLTAPFPGTVTDVHFESGEYARAGTPIITLSGDGELEVEVEVPESVIARIATSDAVDLRLPALTQETITGRVKSVGRTAAGPGRLFPVVAVFPTSTGPRGQEIVAGMTAELILRLTSDQALAVPVEAVVNPGGRSPSVFRVADSGAGEHRVEKVEVEIGSLLGNGGDTMRVIVRGTLQAGELVVTGGQRGLLDGETVDVEPAAETER